ncbi:MAG: hypothetical protein DDG59_04970 [Anaerolineae bacterium]|jgi:uncharacterized protein (DUF58 family)|nr:MAG: hypothetical protein DDG59_04970 [Anaerolineae bacterium]
MKLSFTSSLNKNQSSAENLNLLTQITPSPLAIYQLEHLRLAASRYLQGRNAGQRSSLRRKPAVELLAHRKYVVGDDIRFVDWRASARQEHIFIRQGEQPKDLLVYLVLDCSASMQWGNPPKSIKALELAAALGYTCLSNGDRLALLTLSQRGFVFWGPLTGKGQFTNLLNFLQKQTFQGQITLLELLQEVQRRSSGQGLVIIISDLLGEEDVQDALKILPAPSWEILLLHLLHPEELDPPLMGQVELEDIETHERASYNIDSKALNLYKVKMQAWCNKLEAQCAQNHVFYYRMNSRAALDKEIIPDFRHIGILQPK